MNQNLGRISVVLGLMLGLAMGCQSQDPLRRPPAGYQDPIPNRDYPHVVVEWPLQEYLVVSYDGIVEDDAMTERPMTVQVPVRSMADVQQMVQYRFRWYDSVGRLVSEGGWKRQVVEARLQVQLQGNARTSDASAWRLEIRSSR